MFEDSLSDFKIVIVILNASIKNNVVISISYGCSSHNIIAKTIHHTINFTMTEAELFTIRYRINQAIQVSDASNIIIITNAIHSIR